MPALPGDFQTRIPGHPHLTRANLYLKSLRDLHPNPVKRNVWEETLEWGFFSKVFAQPGLDKINWYYFHIFGDLVLIIRILQQ